MVYKIYVNKMGRFGNASFQFMASRLFKILYGHIIVYDLNLLTDPLLIDDNVFIKWMNNILDGKDLDNKYKYKDLYFNGFFQHDDIFINLLPILIKYISMSPLDYFIDDREKKYNCNILLNNPINDYSHFNTVIHIRIEDFITYDLAIDPRCYNKLIEDAEAPILIIHNKISSPIDFKYINYFKKNYPDLKFFDGDLKEAYSIMRTAKNLICSTSTLSWIAGFFNTIKNKIYIPQLKYPQYWTTFKNVPYGTIQLYDWDKITKNELEKVLFNININEKYKIMSSTNLSAIFKPNTQVHYPIFKTGKYLEEYFLDYFNNENPDLGSYKYIDCLWTNLHHSPNFNETKHNLNVQLQEQLLQYSSDTKFFTVVQWDDGPLLDIPKNTIIFGSCSGTIPLPLIYEDTDNKLLSSGCNYNANTNEYTSKIGFKQREILCSFIGSLTHPVRDKMKSILENKDGFFIQTKGWNPNINQNEAHNFIEITQHSKFALAPRGYGRSSFRFFEIFLLGTIPVYIYDDIEWLPYKDVLNYKDFCISIHESEIEKLPNILENITEEEYNTMWAKYNKIAHYFTVETMTKYIINTIRIECQRSKD
jgi:hypothetical protein